MVLWRAELTGNRYFGMNFIRSAAGPGGRCPGLLGARTACAAGAVGPVWLSLSAVSHSKGRCYPCLLAPSGTLLLLLGFLRRLCNRALPRLFPRLPQPGELLGSAFDLARLDP